MSSLRQSPGQSVVGELNRSRSLAVLAVTLVLAAAGCGGSDKPNGSALGDGNGATAVANSAPGDFAPGPLSDDQVCALASTASERLRGDLGDPEVERAKQVQEDSAELTPHDFRMCSFSYGPDGEYGTLDVAQLSNRANELLNSDAEGDGYCPVSRCVERLPNMYVAQTSKGSIMLQVYLYPPDIPNESYDAYDQEIAAALLAGLTS